MLDGKIEIPGAGKGVKSYLKHFLHLLFSILDQYSKKTGFEMKKKKFFSWPPVWPGGLGFFFPGPKKKFFFPLKTSFYAHIHLERKKVTEESA